jgi:thymidylate kinase
MLFKKNPSIFIVAVVGPDGVGKTTSINECKNKLKENNYSFISKHHVWGDLDERPINHNSKHISYFKPLPDKSRSNIIIKGYNYIISNLNQIYEEVKYLRKLNRMILEASKKYKVILIDRYIFDKIAAKEARIAFDIQYYLRRILATFTFKPNLCIMLSNTPLEIHNRKHELSIVEAKLYLESIKKIAKRKSYGFHEVITDKAPNIVGEEMFDSINEFNLNNKFIIKESADKLI